VGYRVVREKEFHGIPNSDQICTSAVHSLQITIILVSLLPNVQTLCFYFSYFTKNKCLLYVISTHARIN
jgi:hypothetical protein